MLLRNLSLISPWVTSLLVRRLLSVGLSIGISRDRLCLLNPPGSQGETTAGYCSHKQERSLKCTMTAIHISVWLSNASELLISSFNWCDNWRIEISKHWQKAAEHTSLAPGHKLLPPSPHFYPLQVHSVPWSKKKRLLQSSKYLKSNFKSKWLQYNAF